MLISPSTESPSAQVVTETDHPNLPLRSYQRVSDWEDGFLAPDLVTYYRHFPALHPRFPLDQSHDGRPITSVSVPPNQALSNIKMSMKILSIGNLLPDSNKVRVKVKLRATWAPALPELRSFDDDDIVDYKPLTDDEGCTPAILEVRHKYGVRLGRTISTVRPSHWGEPEQLVKQEKRHFLGPTISLRTSCGKRNDPLFDEEDLGEKCLGTGRLHGRPDDHPRSPASGNRHTSLKLEAELDVHEDLLCEGGLRCFPFDTLVATLHVNSMHGFREIAFQEFDPSDQNALKEQIGQSSDSNSQWKIVDIHATSEYRTWDGEEMPKVQVTRPTELDRYRSKIVLRITFGQRRGFWLMKIIFPLDVITTMGFGIFLVIPSLVSPTQDQQLSILAFLATILVALSAFSVSVGNMLPQRNYTTVFDVHSNFCFGAIAVLAIVVAGIPTNEWSIFKFESVRTAGHADRSGVLFTILIFCFIFEHALLYCLVIWVWTVPSFLKDGSNDSLNARYSSASPLVTRRRTRTSGSPLVTAPLPPTFMSPRMRTALARLGLTARDAPVQRTSSRTPSASPTFMSSTTRTALAKLGLTPDDVRILRTYERQPVLDDIRDSHDDDDGNGGDDDDDELPPSHRGRGRSGTQDRSTSRYDDFEQPAMHEESRARISPQRHAHFRSADDSP